jgi:hypothetical protein
MLPAHMQRCVALKMKLGVSFKMKRCFLLALAAALLVSGCADNLAPEPTDRPAAPYSPDATSHLPDPTRNVPGDRGSF